MKRTWTIPLALGLLVTACDGSARDERTTESATTARTILEAARNRLGGAAVDSFNTVRAEAKVEGPDMTFVTIIWSARDGRARMEQSEGFTAGTHPAGNWMIDGSTGRVEPLDDLTLAFVRGHELHAAVWVPESRYQDPEFVGVAEFDDRQALTVSLTDHLGKSLLAYFSAVDTMPLGFRMLQPDPDVFVTLDGWERRGNLLVFTRALFSQGDEEFQYEYVDIQLNEVPDSIFVAPSDTTG